MDKIYDLKVYNNFCGSFESYKLLTADEKANFLQAVKDKGILETEHRGFYKLTNWRSHSSLKYGREIDLSRFIKINDREISIDLRGIDGFTLFEYNEETDKWFDNNKYSGMFATECGRFEFLDSLLGDVVFQ